jgi:hypothetical protein
MPTALGGMNTCTSTTLVTIGKGGGGGGVGAGGVGWLGLDGSGPVVCASGGIWCAFATRGGVVGWIAGAVGAGVGSTDWDVPGCGVVGAGAPGGGGAGRDVDLFGVGAGTGGRAACGTTDGGGAALR